ncbi:hypothetical protein CDG60_05680 [Acinetobacter chinensis]|uniref:ATP-grasp domain-containing protein n=1 Tax=Acinetobacter chinensis TaxID=2004650 RepID=A0A3B7LVU6_9GAMM|nr:YheC/YheD family protein [Acinetobacter chinensis]AXY56105.1 hypothetical protein CDG60_05680 [Acinetobacter chinensis]
MKVGFLRFDQNPTIKVRAIAYICHYHNIDFFYFQPEDVDFEKKKINGRFFINENWEYRETDFPDLIDNAPSIAKYRSFYDEMTKYVPFMCFRIGNKQKVQNILEKDGEFSHILIETEEVEGFEKFDHFLNRMKSVILKPNGGNMGRNIIKISKIGNDYKVETDGEIINLSNLKKWFDEHDFRGYIQQEYVNSLSKNNLPFDIRIHVRRGLNKKWNVVKVYPRIGINQNVTSNISQGGSISKLVGFLKNNYEDYEEIQKKLNKFARDFPPYFQKFYNYDLDALGIDIGLDKEGNLKLFEVNTYPGSNFLDIEDSVVRVHYYHSFAKQGL